MTAQPSFPPGSIVSDPPLSVPRLSRLSPQLSGRELQVLTLIADGHTNLEIADELGLVEATVKTHVHRMLRKLNAHDRAEAVAVAFRVGWLS